jgi:hypothetical protein
MAAEELAVSKFFTVLFSSLRSASPQVFRQQLIENSVVQFLFCLLAFLSNSNKSPNPV